MSDKISVPETYLTRFIIEYLDNGNSVLRQSIVDTMKTFANTHFHRQDTESLRSAKEHFKSRVIADEYDSGEEMHGPNNFNKGLVQNIMPCICITIHLILWNLSIHIHLK
jgi:hypothetical protein